jgi:hypothetical protein
MNFELLLTNVGYIGSLIVCSALGLLVLLRGPKEYRVNVIFFLFNFSIVVWQVSYVIGINLADPIQSRLAFMFNVFTVFIVVFNSHVILYVTKRIEKHRRTLWLMYIVATLIVIFYVLFPDTFLLPSEPRLYLPNFFKPGPLYFIGDLFFFFVSIFYWVQIYVGYKGADYITRNRLRYFIVGQIFGFIVGLVPELLLYGINVDPFPASFMGLYSLPMGYSIIKYDILDLKIVAKRALIYGVSIVCITAFILFIGYANESVLLLYPGFPGWVFPFLSALLAVAVGVFVWHKIKELDELKFEFVNVVTHKFRTPLTYVRWSLDTLKTSTNPSERALAMDAIEQAHTKLFELTDALTGLTSSDTSEYLYHFTSETVRSFIDESVRTAEGRLHAQGIVPEINIAPDLPPVHVDRRTVQFAVQMIFDNAIIYSPKGGKVVINAERKGEYIYLSIKDFGIGIRKEDIPRLFTKFYRSSGAMHAHTEGLGIGLYLSREILKRNGGNIWAESEGTGKGSTFNIKIPIKK